MLKELRELRRFARDSSLAAFLSAIVGHVTTLLMVSYAKFNMGLSKKTGYTDILPKWWFQAEKWWLKHWISGVPYFQIKDIATWGFLTPNPID